MSGEEHKKGRVSELEGQQRASGRAMFLLSGPQREGAKEGSRERGSMRGGEEGEWSSLFSWLAREIMRAERFGHPALAFLPLLPLLRRPIHWSAGRRCHVNLARKENRGGGGGYALPREGRSKGGSVGAPVKTPVLGFHSLNWV